MHIIKCLYCNNDIDKNFLHKQCPICGNVVGGDEELRTFIFLTIFRAKNEGVYDALKTHIFNSENEQAIEIIRALWDNKKRLVVEQKVIERILNEKPANWTYTEAPNVSIPTPASNTPALVSCKACGNQISNHAETCPHCGHPTGVHVCPKCGGIRTRVISGASKTASIFLWGAYAANKVRSTYECLDCKQKF